MVIGMHLTFWPMIAGALFLLVFAVGSVFGRVIA